MSDLLTFEGFPPEGLSLFAELPQMEKDDLKARRERYEEKLREPLKAFVAALGPVLKERVSSGIEFAPRTHGSLERVPKGFDDEHEQADLLRHKWLQLRWGMDHPNTIGKPGFVDYCADELARARGVHLWLVEHLG